MEEILNGEYREDAISTEENKLIDRKLKELEEVIGPGIRAKYTVRITLQDGGAMTPVPGLLAVWTHGGREHTEAHLETKLYFCPGRRLGVSDCERIMPELANNSVTHVCPSCGCSFKADAVIGERAGVLTRQGWARELTSLVEELGREVQIEFTVWSKGVRAVNRQEMRKTSKGDNLRKYREKKLYVQYRFPSLLRDLKANGNDLHQRMRALLEAAT